ncbi:class IIb bacteriocin, lactobin A/cerein 7B family [Geobacillus sp. C56-T2]|jgi:lactobin A/cerein 7B family class IIb bacteriocin|uniref:class IIb bacteriocin, lactobin A/cerein 7B family n=1 Tax=Geobacillus sp. C56-T2 TaxID=600773 RepID=UPI0011A2F0FB|nr:class IIb bacteriocin, lactobin A/cerein 7B family [Geobacillus sp. C56-T2]NNV06479.1 class IIb bacteriocin, lactobin A/cerein 7B family [Geobacillus sp. MMMUD3]TWG29339.1 lactobin A/cerein 7B family class IIb bacteriocin [Geobacillus sp. C56-T2]
MSKLEIANARDLTEQELRETDGGWVPWAIAGGLFIIGGIAGYMDQKQENKKNKCGK